MPFTHTVNAAELAALYRRPSALVTNKSQPTIDTATAAFIGRSTFAIVSTSASDGPLDASPRGGEPGFVQVIDERRLAIADLGGNNRLDSIRNLVDTGQIGVAAKRAIGDQGQKGLPTAGKAFLHRVAADDDRNSFDKDGHNQTSPEDYARTRRGENLGSVQFRSGF